MDTYRNLHGYEYTQFREDLEKLKETHMHRVRRHEEVTYRDEFALMELNDLYPELYQQYLEGWSRSYYQGSKHLEAVHQYGIPDISITHLEQPTYQQAMRSVAERLRSLPRVRAFDVLTELDLVHYEQSSSAGFDYVGHKGPRYGNNHIRAIRRAKATMWSALQLTDPGMDHVIRTAVPDVGYTRTQLTDLTEKTKIRGVWGRAFHYILLEGTTAYPLLEAFKRGETFFHIGRDPTISVPHILSETKRSSEYLIGLDWSAFDATVSRFEIHAAFDIIRELMTFPNYETEQTFEICRHLFIHKKIAAPDGNIYWSHKGIPSGSYFTSLIGSIVNRLRVEYLWRIIHGRSPKMCYTQGDDSLIGDDVYTDPELLARHSAPLNWRLNPAKTEISRAPEYVSFLGRTIYGGLNQRDLKKCLRLLIFPEFQVNTGSISAYRAASIAQDAGRTSKVLNEIASRLRRRFGVAEEDDVPRYFKVYVP